MKNLDLSGVKLDGDQALIISACVRNLAELNLSRCQIDTFGIEAISNEIKNLSRPVILCAKGTYCILSSLWFSLGIL